MDDVLGYEGKRVLVTGAASGMGAATAELLVSLGAEVHAIDVNPILAEGCASVSVTDVGDPAAIDRVLGAIAGRLDGVFNCAGVPTTAPGLQIILVNFVGLRHLTEGALSMMQRGGAVANIGSIGAVAWMHHHDIAMELVETPDFEAGRAWAAANLSRMPYPYETAKEAVNWYSLRRAVELAPEGIRMNCTNPGATRTGITAEFAKQMSKELISKFPTLMGRIGRPIEQAWPLVFLNSERASYISGATIYVDGAFTAALFTGQVDPVVSEAFKWSLPDGRQPGDAKRT